MKVGSVISATADRYGIEFDNETDKERLLLCYYLTEREIAENYIPLLAMQDFTCDKECRIFYRDFHLLPIRIVGVYDKNGVSVKYTIHHNYITVPTVGEYTVHYHYTPKEKKLEDACEYDLFAKDCLVCGIAAEHFLLCGDIEGAGLATRDYKRHLLQLYKKSRFLKCTQGKRV